MEFTPSLLRRSLAAKINISSGRIDTDRVFLSADVNTLSAQLMEICDVSHTLGLSLGSTALEQAEDEKVEMKRGHTNLRSRAKSYHGIFSVNTSNLTYNKQFVCSSSNCRCETPLFQDLRILGC